MALNGNQIIDDLSIYLPIYDSFIRSKYLSFATGNPDSLNSTFKRTKNNVGLKKCTVILESRRMNLNVN